MPSRIVADTNILISSLGWHGNEFKLIEKCMKGDVILIISLDILEEFRSVASRPKFGFLPEEIEEFIGALIEAGELVQPEEKVKLVKEDPSDNKFIDAALEGKANYIVSGDVHLLKFKRVKDIKIVRAGEVLDLL